MCGKFTTSQRNCSNVSNDKQEISSRPNFYSKQVTVPIEEFLIETQHLIRPQLKENLVSQILSVVTFKYLEMSKDLIQQVQHSEEVIKRMVKRSQTTKSTTSDLDKIYIQLYIDVEQYGSQIKKLGIDEASFEPFQQLNQCVNPGKKLKLELETINNESSKN